MKKQLIKFLRDEEGLTIVEYAVAGGLIAAGAVLVFTNLGAQVVRIIGFLVTELSTAP